MLALVRKSPLLGMIAIVRLAEGQQPGGPAPRPTARYEVTVEKNVMVPMRDGVRLAADLYRPTGAGDRLPVIMMRTPYNKDTYGGAISPARYFAGQGYLVVSQDVRGQFNSEGDYRVQLKDSDDGYDTIEWIVKQPWSTGKVGTYGCSYLGEVQYLLAKRRHPAHVAMIPQSASGATGPAGGFYTNFGAYEGGALTLSSIFGWFGFAGHKVRASPDTRVGQSNLPKIDFPAMLKSLPVRTMAQRAGFPASDFEDYVTHPPADPYWDEVGYLRDDDRFDTPAIHVNSWLDVTPEQTLYDFNLMRKNGVTARARDNQFAIMSPTTHCASEAATERTKVGDREFGDARLPYWNIYLDWFDYWLRDRKSAVLERPKVQYYVMGKNEWRSAATWPVPEMRVVPYYLSSGGRANTGAGDGVLSTVKPARANQDTFVYDPENPFPSRGGTICCTGNPNDQPGVFDQSDLESRADLLVYSTAPLERPVTIAGTVKAVLYVSSDAKDTDFAAKLIDVDPDGKAWNVLNGIKRARYRDGMTKTVWMVKDKVYRVELSLKATAYQFAAGHRIRLHLTSSDFPLYDRNLNTGGDNVSETAWVKATNTVHHGGGSLSQLVLPVVPN
jgi:putative CocE/NonD family hydrolase